MTALQLFDSVRLRETITLTDGQLAPAGTRGAIVALLQDGEAYLVELFGEWVKVDDEGNLVAADTDDPDAFVETIGVTTLAPEQLERLEPAQETVGGRTHLLAIVDDLPEDALTEVVDFAEFLRQKQRTKERV